MDFFGPEGSCFYLADDPTRPLLLIGTGTGLAPLAGIVRDALAQGHTGPIRLYFTYTSCTSADGSRAEVTAFTETSDTTGYRVYLCGHPEMVKRAQRKAFLRGASLSDIYTNPFVRALAPS